MTPIAHCLHAMLTYFLGNDQSFVIANLFKTFTGIRKKTFLAVPKRTIVLYKLI